MGSLSVHEVFRQARSAVYDPEDVRFGDLDVATADAATGLLEGMAESEFERRIGVKVRERGPQRNGHRNGYRERLVQLPFTSVTIRIPRFREEGFIPSFLAAGSRAIAAVERWVEQAFLCGISRAEIIRFMQSTTGCRPSDDLLRRVQERLDTLVGEFRERELSGRYIYLFLDAAWVKDIVGLGARRICILCAIGVTAEGKKEILGFVREPRECAAGWSRFLGSLIARGLDPSALELVISDEHEGIKAAVQQVLGDVRHQYCWAHRCRNIFEAVAKADRRQMVASLRAAYQAEHEMAARTALRELDRQWSERYPSIVTELRKDAGNLLAFYHAPELHREYVRTSNPVERTFLELRRSRFGCGAFANREACDRVCGHTFIRLNKMWQEVDLWEERRRKRQTAEKRRKQQREQQEEQAAASAGQRDDGSRLAHRTDPVSGARVAPQQSPPLPDGRDLTSVTRAA